MDKPKNRIRLHAHCGNCMPQKPVNQAMSEWARIDAGFTEDGLQLWCKRCRMQIAHFTPEGLSDALTERPGCDCCPGGRHSN